MMNHQNNVKNIYDCSTASTFVTSVSLQNSQVSYYGAQMPLLLGQTFGNMTV